MKARGMTLLEVMVAMAIFAVAGLALLKTATEQVTGIALLEEKTFAGWVAENQLVQLRLEGRWPGLGWSKGKEEQAGRTWFWQWQGVETPDPNFRALDVEVRDSANATDPRAGLRTYVAR